jgi:phosphoserine aminotransferase
MITFYPGPSKLYPQVQDYMIQAYQTGILSANHRSGQFMRMLEATVQELKNKLGIPAGHEVYFTSSATECWEIVAQSFVKRRSAHLFNGAFGAKWFDYSRFLRPDSLGEWFALNEVPLLSIGSDAEVLCLTHNETSNGTYIPDEGLAALRDNFGGLIALDATSSMAGVILPWELGDIWFASAQKCFGLPSGLGIMVVSPKAIEVALEIGERSHYNSLLFIRDNFLKNQTHYTPNILGIYLLGKVAEQVAPIEQVSKTTRNRALHWYDFLEKNGYEVACANPATRSDTIIAVTCSPGKLADLKVRLLARGITIGNGYGEWKESSFRIANFPAIETGEIELLKEMLKQRN